MLKGLSLTLTAALATLMLSSGVPAPASAGAATAVEAGPVKTVIDLDNDLSLLPGHRLAAQGGLGSARVRNCGRNREVTLVVTATGRVLGTDRTDFDGYFNIAFDAIARKRLTAIARPAVRRTPHGLVLCSRAAETEHVRVEEPRRAKP